MNKRTRRLLLLAVAALLLASLGGVVLWPRQPASEITPANAAKIRAGMTQQEVASLLGGPARNELTGRPLLVDGKPRIAVDKAGLPFTEQSLREGPLLARGFEVARWQSDYAQILVGFTPDGRVGECVTFSMRFADRGILDTLRRWLHL